MTRLKICMAGATAVLLSACATSAPVNQRISESLPGSISYSYDPITDTLALKNGTTTLETLPKTGTMGIKGSFGNYSDGTTAVAYSQTGSGKGQVAVIASAAVAHSLLGAVISRDGAVSLPTVGSASLNGDYVGFLMDKGLMNGTTITGAACLTASFDAGTIGGSIINRNGYTYNNITIPDMQIASGGSFSGPISGGESTVAGSTASGGQIMGMFADPAAGEVVGGLRLDHVINGIDAIEVGGFTTTSGPCI